MSDPGPSLKPMSFWERLDNYTQAVGVDEVACAWDLAGAPLSDADHRHLMAGLVSQEGDTP